MTHCPVTGVNIVRFILSVIVGFIFVFIYDFVYHGQFLMEFYKASAHLWRGPDEMKQYFPIALLSQLGYVVMLAFVFTSNYEEKGIGEGFRYGALIGLLMGVAQFGIYPYMPISFDLAILWFSGTVVQVTVLGAIFALIYKK